LASRDTVTLDNLLVTNLSLKLNCVEYLFVGKIIDIETVRKLESTKGQNTKKVAPIACHFRTLSALH